MIEPVRLPDGQRILCPYCNTVYSNWQTFKTHYETVHQPAEYYKCRLCNTTIKHKVYFRKHITTKHFKLLWDTVMPFILFRDGAGAFVV